MVDNEKELLETQKKQLAQDVKLFKENIIKKIEGPHCDEMFDNLGIFGNFYKLAIESDSGLKEELDKFNAEVQSIEEQKETLTKQSSEMVDEIFKRNNVRVVVKSDSGWDPREFPNYSTYIYIGDEIAYSGDSKNTPGSPAKIISWYKDVVIDRLRDDKHVKHYCDLSRKLKELEGKQSPLSAIKRMILQKQMAKMERYESVWNYINVRGPINGAHSDFQSEEYKSIIKQMDTIGEVSGKRKADLKNALNSKSTSVLALKYLSIYNNNYEYLRMMPDGAKKSLAKLLTTNTEYYARHDIQTVARDINKWLKIDKIASKLHEGWRETKKKEDGSYQSSWKVVKDDTLAKKVTEMESLPDNFRIVDGQLQQDIANTHFGDLCLNYQIENFEAAQVAYEISKSNYARADAGIVGKKIHDEWLKRNPYAKGGELDVEFIDLLYTDKLRDLIHYDIAKKIVSEEEISHLT